MTQQEITLLNLGSSLDDIANIDPRGYGVCKLLYKAAREYTGEPLCVNGAKKLISTLREGSVVFIQTGFILLPFIILSMTPAERENPSILGSSRKKRIAAGSGTQVSDVNRLLKQFDLMQNMVKQMTSGKGMFGKMRSGGFPGMPGMGGMGRMGRKGRFPF